MELNAVPGVPEIRAGDDLAVMLADLTDLPEANRRKGSGGSKNGPRGGFRDGDILCIASTVVSKAEGRTHHIDDFTAGERAREIASNLEECTGEPKDPRFAQAVLNESEELIVEAPFLLTVTQFGHVTVNAGIDRSNVPNGDLLLLPEDPSASAAVLHDELNIPVIVTDTSGRPFRHGQRGVAVGWAGMPASRDWRGETDRNGRELGVTVQSVVDELAGAANLVAGEGDGGTPAVIIHGFEFGDHRGSNNLFRNAETDFVRQALRDWEYSN